MMVFGGPVIWILLVLAVVSVVIYFVRLLDLRRAQIDYRDFLNGVENVLDRGNVDEALANCEDIPAPVAQVVATAIHSADADERTLHETVDSQGRAEIGRLDRRLAALAIIGQIAPILGLLGTVIGFIKTVMAANLQEVVSRIDLMNGAMEALVSAAAGMAVAVLAIVMYGSLRVRLERIAVELEVAANMIVGYLTDRKGTNG